MCFLVDATREPCLCVCITVVTAASATRTLALSIPFHHLFSCLTSLNTVIVSNVDFMSNKPIPPGWYEPIHDIPDLSRSLTFHYANVVSARSWCVCRVSVCGGCGREETLGERWLWEGGDTCLFHTNCQVVKKRYQMSCTTFDDIPYKK